MKTTIKTLLLLAFTATFTLSSYGYETSFSLYNNGTSNGISDSLKDTLTKCSVENKDNAPKVRFEAEKMPEFKGGTKALIQYLQRNVSYPQDVREKEIEDKVYVEFVVNIDGSLSETKALTGKNQRLKAEAVSAVTEMPKWIPATEKGKAVPVRLLLPISFVLK